MAFSGINRLFHRENPLDWLGKAYSDDPSVKPNIPEPRYPERIARPISKKTKVDPWKQDFVKKVKLETASLKRAKDQEKDTVVKNKKKALSSALRQLDKVMKIAAKRETLSEELARAIVKRVLVVANLYSSKSGRLNINVNKERYSFDSYQDQGGSVIEIGSKKNAYQLKLINDGSFMELELSQGNNQANQYLAL